MRYLIIILSLIFVGCSSVSRNVSTTHLILSDGEGYFRVNKNVASFHSDYETLEVLEIEHIGSLCERIVSELNKESKLNFYFWCKYE